MTDAAPKTIGLVANGFGGWRLWTRDDADDPTVAAVSYILDSLAAEHKRLMAERDAEVGSWRMVAEMNGATARTHCEQVAEREVEIARLREALEEAATRLANARHTFCLASPGTDTEFHSWLAGLDHAATIMKGADNG